MTKPMYKPALCLHAAEPKTFNIVSTPVRSLTLLNNCNRTGGFGSRGLVADIEESSPTPLCERRQLNSLEEIRRSRQPPGAQASRNHRCVLHLYEEADDSLQCLQPREKKSRLLRPRRNSKPHKCNHPRIAFEVFALGRGVVRVDNLAELTDDARAVGQKPLNALACGDRTSPETEQAGHADGRAYDQTYLPQQRHARARHIEHRLVEEDRRQQPALEADAVKKREGATV